MLATDGHRFQQFQSWRLHWIYMRDPEIIEDELMEISAIADDSVKLERIIAWCAAHPDEVPFALHQMMQLMQRRGSAE